MGWSAIIETDRWDVYRLIRPNGGTGGKALLSFLSMANAGCEKYDHIRESDYAWIETFSKMSGVRFCELVTQLDAICYSGNWYYKVDEFELFQRRSPNMQMTEADFKDNKSSSGNVD